MDKLDTLRTNAGTAYVLMDEVETAKEDARSADAELLEAIIDLIEPSLRSLAGTIKTGYKEWWVNSTPQEMVFYAKARGLRVAGSRSAVGPELDYTSQHGGHYKGEDLFLLRGCRFLEMTYEGEFSCRQGSPSSWRVHEALLSPAEVVEKYDLGEIVTEISGSIHRWIDVHEKVPATYRQRAAKMRSLRALLED